MSHNSTARQPIKYVRARLAGNFTQVPNSMFSPECPLSIGARYVLIDLMSRKDGWTDSVETMHRRLPQPRTESGQPVKGTGIRAMYGYWKELEEAGCIVRERQRVNGQVCTRITGVRWWEPVPVADLTVPPNRPEQAKEDVSAGRTDSTVPLYQSEQGKHPVFAGGTDSTVPPALSKDVSRNTEEASRAQTARDAVRNSCQCQRESDGTVMRACSAHRCMICHDSNADKVAMWWDRKAGAFAAVYYCPACKPDPDRMSDQERNRWDKAAEAAGHGALMLVR
jgi:hypothetical protein